MTRTRTETGRPASQTTPPASVGPESESGAQRGAGAACGALAFVVTGDPVPWERVQSRRGQHFTAPRTREYQERVRLAAGACWPIEGPVRVRLAFYRATARRCDWDNLAKTICDALNGIAWDDDAQIATAEVTKGVDRERPRVEVEIAPAGTISLSPAEAETVDALLAKPPQPSPALRAAAESRRNQRVLTQAANATRSSVRRFRDEPCAATDCVKPDHAGCCRELGGRHFAGAKR